MIFDMILMILIWFMKMYDDELTLLRWFTVAIYMQSFTLDIWVNEISLPEGFSTNEG